MRRCLWGHDPETCPMRTLTLPALPQRLDALAKRARAFREQPPPEALRRLGVRGAAHDDQRRQPRAPRRKRSVRCRIAEQHGEILIRAEPVAHALRFGDPELAEFRPERLDQLHLIAMCD